MGKFKLSQDLQHFYRNLRLKTYFGLQQDLTRNRIPTTVENPIPELSHFLHILKQFPTTPPGCLLVTFNVKSLYTSIKHDLGIKAVGDLLEHSAFSINSRHLCFNLVSLILHENYFLFGDQFYLQTQGTAMGANVAPAYANIYMDSFEYNYVYENILFKTHNLCWFCYIDDMFCIWMGPYDTLVTFTEHLNSIRPELQFTLNYSLTHISFLDTLVTREPSGQLSTDIISKPTDSNSLLTFHSCHPSSIKHSLPSSQFKRVTCIVSNPSLLPGHVDKISLKFAARHYPKNLLDRENCWP
ncbi:unnamed protein product [Ranitomeya imitator]|uniref:Reverse transcriptase domain-containing protein n=1 Tax=Ranitomeya imitator TaxID=111125 RepID=A0ABN9MPW8_9NEOB|nr:unnamed protein product [Ranitomeya imitator]